MQREISYNNVATKTVAQVALGVMLMVLSAKLTIQIQPIPITMHELGIVLIGLLFSPAMALATQCSYVGLGLMGVPVFSNMLAGPAVVFGPKGGFILSFLFASSIIAYLKDKVGGKYGHWVATAVGLAFVFAAGVAWLAQFVGGAAAVELGLLPFMLPLVVKMAVICSLWGWFKRG